MDEDLGRGAEVVALAEAGDLVGPGDVVDRGGHVEFAGGGGGTGQAAEDLQRRDVRRGVVTEESVTDGVSPLFLSESEIGAAASDAKRAAGPLQRPRKAAPRASA